jgi:hypothetical protein
MLTALHQSWENVVIFLWNTIYVMEIVKSCRRVEIREAGRMWVVKGRIGTGEILFTCG